MAVVAYIMFNGVELDDVEDEQIEIAGFIDDVCRGTYRLYDMEYPGHPFPVFLQVWGSPTDNGKPFSFKIYDHFTAMEYTAEQTPEYQYNGILGYPTLYEITIDTKATQTAPDAPALASKTATSITLVALEGCEYSKEEGEWQESPLFAGLTPKTTYTFTQRKKETDTHFASGSSEAASFETEEAFLPIYTILSSVNNTTWGSITPYGESKVEEGDVLTFTITAQEGYEIEQLLVDGFPISDCTTNSYTFENVTENHTIEVVFKENVGIGTFTIDELQITVYPNPTTGELRITNYELRIENVEVFDIYRREQFLRSCDLTVLLSFNISHHPNGIYFKKITTEKGTVTKKIIKY
jgi:hypothetical protein